jgi:ABC-type sugar transport system permease subunit
MRWYQRLFPYALVSPLLVLVLVFLAFPIAASFVISFFALNLANPQNGVPFVGLANYFNVLGSAQFVPMLGRSAYFTIVSTGLTIALGLGAAVALRAPFPGARFVRSIIILPWAVPAIIAGLLWKTIYDSGYGQLNGILSSFGIIHRYVPWMSDGFTALNFVLITQLWIKLPFAIILFSAALAALPTEVEEAALVDGATPFGSFRYVVLPLLRPMIALVFVLSTAWELFAFDTIYAITGGGPAHDTTVLAYYTWQETFSFLQFGLGAALGWVITLAVVVVGFAYVRALGQETQL